jgi:hypothetical protein
MGPQREQAQEAGEFLKRTSACGDELHLDSNIAPLLIGSCERSRPARFSSGSSVKLPLGDDGHEFM